MTRAFNINKKILDEATEDLELNGYSKESLEIITKALCNLEKIEEIKKHMNTETQTYTSETYIDKKESPIKKSTNPHTEFEEIIYNIPPSKENMIYITKIIGEHMEECRLLYPKQYIETIKKLKELIK